MSELKACPFCNSVALIDSYINDMTDCVYQIYCSNCRARMSYYTEDAAIEAWNIRHQPLEPMYYAPEQMQQALEISNQYVKQSLKYEKLLEFVKRVSNSAPSSVTDGIAMSAFELLEEIDK